MRFLSFLVFGSACWVALAQPAAPPSTAAPAFDKAKFESYIRRVELLPQELPVKVGDPEPSMFPGFNEVYATVVTPRGDATIRYYVSQDGQRIIKGNLFDIGKNPFQPELNKLTTANQPSFGPAGAPVTIVEFSDFECPNCKEEAKALRTDLPKAYPNQVRVVFKDFPLEKMHPWARQAAIAGRCVYRQNPAAFWDFYDWIYDHQEGILPDDLKTQVAGWADSKNLDSAKIGACMASNAPAAEIAREIAEGTSLQVNGTPMMFVNGRPITGAVPWQALDEVIKRELGYVKTAANASDKCCEISIPTLLPAKKQ
jgi:protein-disulfide isomerase